MLEWLLPWIPGKYPLLIGWYSIWSYNTGFWLVDTPDGVIILASHWSISGTKPGMLWPSDPGMRMRFVTEEDQSTRLWRMSVDTEGTTGLRLSSALRRPNQPSSRSLTSRLRTLASLTRSSSWTSAKSASYKAKVCMEKFIFDSQWIQNFCFRLNQ